MFAARSLAAALCEACLRFVNDWNAMHPSVHLIGLDWIGLTYKIIKQQQSHAMSPMHPSVLSDWTGSDLHTNIIQQQAHAMNPSVRLIRSDRTGLSSWYMQSICPWACTLAKPCCSSILVFSTQGLRALQMSLAYLTEEEALKIVQNNGRRLDEVPTEYRSPELCRAAVQHSGSSLEFVPPFWKDEELCLTAVKKMDTH